MKSFSHDRMMGHIVLLLMLLLFTACQSSTAASASQSDAGVIGAENGTRLSPTLIPTDPKPVVVYTATAPVNMPSFDPAKPDTLPQTAVPTSIFTHTPVPSLTPTPPPTPTNTPPHLLFTSPDEHYWFWRPVAEGETNWTDKVYPYGSTKGGTLRTHHGVEFYVPTGTTITAVADGTVRVAANDAAVVYGPHTNFYGNLIIIEHDARLNGAPVYSLYAHLSEVLVEEGQHVLIRQLIALSGATGVADGAHLHFEVRLGQNSYDHTRNPLLWLYPFPDRGTVVGRVRRPNGDDLAGAPVALTPLNGTASRSYNTTTYADDSVNSDEQWQENFAIDDVFGGEYKVTVQIGEEKFSQEIVVQPYRTTFVEIVIDD